MKKKLEFQQLLVIKAFSKGFTLLEMLVAMAINGMIAATLFGFLLATNKIEKQLREMNELQSNVKMAVTYLVGKISLAGYDPMNIGFRAVDLSSNNKYIKFFADINENGMIPPEDKKESVNESIVFKFDLKKQVIKNWINQTIVYNITDLSFTYEPSVENIQYVKISLTGRTKHEFKNYFKGYNISGSKYDGTCKTYTVERYIPLRNLL